MEEKQKIVRLHSNSRSYSVYTRDSAVRQPAVLPKQGPRPAKSREERIREERRKRWERNVRKHAIQREIRSRYEKANIWNRTEMTVIGFMLAAMLASCVFYLSQQASIMELTALNGSLETEYVTLVRNNDALANRIETEIDYQEIYDYAVGELGMQYPAKSQIIYYQKGSRGLVYQRDDIPEKSE